MNDLDVNDDTRYIQSWVEPNCYWLTGSKLNVSLHASVIWPLCIGKSSLLTHDSYFCNHVMFDSVFSLKVLALHFVSVFSVI